AGDIGHVVVADEALCRCGNVGCLDAVAGGLAIAREAGIAAAEGRSPFLTRLSREGTVPTAADVGRGAYRGDEYCIELLARCGGLIGRTLATLVTAYNPSLVVVGGGVAQSGEILLSAMRDSMFRHSRSLAMRDVTLVRAELGRTAGLVGAAFAVVDDLFSRERVRTWLGDGRPTGTGSDIDPVIGPADLNGSHSTSSSTSRTRWEPATTANREG
ncbi:MAG TPA: ROK family protein, partial [Candidatus Limnocylindrales bacterium]|nr:ROK family protein [Candidatus Limnocylindrales bacterium]